MRRQGQDNLKVEWKEGLCGDMKWVATADGLPIYVEGYTTSEAVWKFESKLREYFRIFGVEVKILAQGD